MFQFNNKKLKKIFKSITIVGLILSCSFLLNFLTQKNSFLWAKKESDKLQIFSKVLSYVKHNYVEEVDEDKLIEGAIKGMLNTLDPHTVWLAPKQYKEMITETKGEFGGIGIEITIKNKILTIVAPIEDTPGYKIGLKAGDIIIKIEDKSTADMDIFEAVKLMRGKPKTPVKITIMRTDWKEPKDFSIIRDIIKVKSIKYQTLEPGYGYIKITQFQEKTSKQLLSALYALKKQNNSLKGLILDLRNNPGGLLPQALQVSDIFIDKGRIVSTVGRDPSKKDIHYAHKEGSFTDFPMAVLINSGSASASEIVAGALQDSGRAIIMGQKSFGKGSVQQIVDLEDESALKLTIAKFATPNDHFIQERGITPDVKLDDIDMEKYEESKLKGPIWREKDYDRHLEGVLYKDDEEGVEKEKPKEEKPQEESKSELLDQDFQIFQALSYLKFGDYLTQNPFFQKTVLKNGKH
ncbi:MAG: S41 family peptidase [Deltaproteobacteria bacterium]|nr:S41 family peptidase [Deltaproteobacteria bacterium]